MDYKVSVYCCTYNHEKYIRQTLESFVNQKTNFAVKFIVHDDASTDSTAQIIKEFADKYPDKIFPIFQTENKYSQHISIIEDYICPVIEGDYVASCEGDDFWTDDNKLQLQYDYMQAHPECTICIHDTDVINEDGSYQNKLYNGETVDRDYSMSEIILAGPSHTGHTSSFFYKRKFASIKKEFQMKDVSDFSRLLYATSEGYAHYIGKSMSVYRWAADGSWTNRIRKDNKKHIQHCKEVIEGLQSTNKYLEYKYNDEFSKLIAHFKYLIYIDRFPLIYKLGDSILNNSNLRNKLKLLFFKR